jgi:hypothetical protein
VSVELRPRRLRRVCRWTALGVLVSFGVLAALLPAQASGRQLSVGDRLSFFAFGFLLAVGVLAFTRPRVQADAEGIRVRNVLSERYFPWGVVTGVQLPDSAPWAQLELHDDQSVGLLAIQANDGDLARAAVDDLNELHRRASAT